MEKLVLQDVVRVFKKNVGVLGVSLEVKEGEFFVILGPSGCGKTTTLRMIAGLETVDSGHIFLDEREITNFPPKLRNISMVFQNYALYPFMTVKDNILFPLKILKMPKSEMEQKVEEIGKTLGIHGTYGQEARGNIWWTETESCTCKISGKRTKFVFNG